jgi:hypothetical protein
MRRNITTCLWASGLTVSSLYGYYAIDHVREPLWFAVMAFAPGLPAFVATVVCCDTAHGFSPGGAVILFTMTTFVLWATVIYVITWFHSRIDPPLTQARVTGRSRFLRGVHREGNDGRINKENHCR